MKTDTVIVIGSFGGCFVVKLPKVHKLERVFRLPKFTLKILQLKPKMVKLVAMLALATLGNVTKTR